MTEENIEATLATFASAVRLEDVAPSAINKAKMLIVDALACAMAGDLAQETSMVRRAAAAVLGDGESTVIGSKRGLSPSGATLVNSYLITAMTVCDVYRPAHCHMTPLVVPSAMSASEEADASGRDFLVASIAGMEVMARVAVGLDYPAFRARGWHSPGVIGPFGAAAAAGSILGFDSETMQHAFGLAATQSAGSYLSWGTPAVKFHQARGAVSGLLAARLAGQGFIGGKRPLTAEDGGIYNTHSNGGDPGAVVAELGTKWEMEQIAVRLWPGASPVQSMLTAIFDLLETEGITAESTTSVEIGISTEDFGTHGRFTRPRGTFEALLSYAYLCSAVLHDQQLWFEQVLPPRIDDDQLLDYGEQRVSLVAVDDLPVNGCRLTARLSDGRELTRRVETARGTPENPATGIQVEQKFRRAANGRLGPVAASEVLDILWDLETHDQLGRLWELLRTE